MASKIYGKLKRFSSLKCISTYENDLVSYELQEEFLVPFSPDTLIEDHQFFEIKSYDSASYCPDFLKKDIVQAELDQASKDQINKLSYILIDQGDFWFIQTILTSHLLQKTSWLDVKDFRVSAENSVLIINSKPDIIVNRKNKSLYFKKLSNANKVFDGIDQLYREATTNEVMIILDDPIVKLANDMCSDKVSIPNRKRVAQVVERFQKMNPTERSVIIESIKGYTKLKIEDESVVIESDNDLKLFLYGLEERYYTTHLGQEKRIANSIIPVSN